VSNEIIKRCSAGIPLGEIFDGDEENCRIALKESIHANEAWKRLYITMVEVSSLTRFVSSNSSPRALEVDSKNHPRSLNHGEHNSTNIQHKKSISKDKRRVSDWNKKIIFAPIEAFMQRCQDMLEVSLKG
jgi:hypothetical protein